MNALELRLLFHCEKQESMFYTMEPKKVRKLSFLDIPAEVRNIIYAYVSDTDSTLDVGGSKPVVQLGTNPAIFRASSWMRKECQELWLARVDMALCFNPGVRLSINEENAFPAAHITSDSHLQIIHRHAQRHAQDPAHFGPVRIQVVCKYTTSFRLRALASFAYAFESNSGVQRVIAATGPLHISVKCPSPTAQQQGGQQLALLEALRDHGASSPLTSFNGMMRWVFGWMMSDIGGESDVLRDAKVAVPMRWDHVYPRDSRLYPSMWRKSKIVNGSHPWILYKPARRQIDSRFLWWENEFHADNANGR